MNKIDKKIKFGVFGCCVSRDPFNRIFVPNYKEFFEIVLTATRVSMICLMDEPVFIENNLIKILPDNQSNRYKTWTINYDITRRFLKQLIEKDLDYLIIDTYLEVFFGVLCWDDKIISYNSYMTKTEFYKNLKNFTHFKMEDNPKKYFEQWKKGCDLFFKFLNKHCPDLKIILHKARPIDRVLRDDGSIYVDEGYTKHKETIAPFMNQLDDYISDNFDVTIIDFDEENALLDENHHWGKGPVHYTSDFYYDFADNLKKIIISDLYHESNLISSLKKANEKLTKRNEILTKTKGDLFYKEKFTNQKLIEANELNSKLINRNEILTKTKNELLKKQNLNEELEFSEIDLNSNQYLMTKQEINNYNSKIYEKNKELNHIKNKYKQLKMKCESQEKYINTTINSKQSKKHLPNLRTIKKRILK